MKIRKICKNTLHLKEKSDYQFKGQLTENDVLQQFKGMIPIEPRYYAAKNSEIDFVIQKGTKIIPIEVKGGEDKSAPSLQHYIDQVDPEHAIRFSQRGYLTNGKITNVPLYLVRKLDRFLQSSLIIYSD